jgi:hypothetical protein
MTCPIEGFKPSQFTHRHIILDKNVKYHFFSKTRELGKTRRGTQLTMYPFLGALFPLFVLYVQVFLV